MDKEKLRKIHSWSETFFVLALPLILFFAATGTDVWTSGSSDSNMRFISNGQDIGGASLHSGNMDIASLMIGCTVIFILVGVVLHVGTGMALLSYVKFPMRLWIALKQVIGKLLTTVLDTWLLSGVGLMIGVIASVVIGPLLSIFPVAIVIYLILAQSWKKLNQRL